MVFRFVVGTPTGPQSSSWRLWSHRDDVYLLQRSSGKIHKFSFHQSGVCRWAQVDERTDGSDRLFFKWNRDPIPPAGSGRASLLASLAIPTNHLSAPDAKLSRSIDFVEPAPPGCAVMIEFFLTEHDKAETERLFAQRGDRHLAFAQLLPNGIHACVSTHNIECGPIDLHMLGEPIKPGQVFGELEFPDKDETESGRPVRMLVTKDNQTPPVVWELGGYERSTLRRSRTAD